MKPSPDYEIVIQVSDYEYVIYTYDYEFVVVHLESGGQWHTPRSWSDGSAGTSTPTSTTSTSAATAASVDGGGSAGGPSAGFLCDKIATALAGLPEDASGPRARADFAAAVGEAYGDDLGAMSGTKVDELLEGTCPDIHAEAVERGEIAGLADYL